MERSLTKVSFSGFEHGCDSVGLEGSGEEEDDLDSSEETRKMVVKRNRKGKKSGGFQSMGMYFILSTVVRYHCTQTGHYNTLVVIVLDLNLSEHILSFC